MTMDPEEINRRGGDTWNMVTNMKNKPNSQGTLFSGGVNHRTPESRQPRGYSPERLKAVQDAVWDNSKTSGYSVETGLPDAQRPIRQLHETLARSTAPLEDIKQALWTVDQVSNREGTDRPGGRSRMDTFSAGEFEYSPGNPHVAGQIAIKKGYERGPVVLHELGHAVDYSQRKPVEGDREHRTSADRGMEEGFADRYADIHARKPGYKSRPDKPDTRPQNWHRGYGLHDSAAQGNFDMGYHATRTPHPGYGPDPVGRQLSFFSGRPDLRPYYNEQPKEDKW